jgi:hypothetical protein
MFTTGDQVEIQNTETGEAVAWTVSAMAGDGLTLTRRGVAPWTSMDQMMGNGAAPTYGTWTREIRFKDGAEVETISETFARH